MNTVQVYERRVLPFGEQERSRACDLPTAVLSDCLERDIGLTGLSAIGDSLATVRVSMAGPAMTVRTRPGDNLAVHLALELVEPGDVLVIDARGRLENAILGELMVRYAAKRGVVGIVVDGAVRDTAWISTGPIPVFARGWTHQGPYRSGPGAIHGTISAGGRPVEDGDIVVGDHDGVAVVPRRRLALALDEAEAKLADEARQRTAIDAGAWDRSWIRQQAEIVSLTHPSSSL